MAERSLRELTKFSKDVGNTPLLDLGAAPGAARAFAKAEFKNPNGTVKDRAALAMLHAAVANALERGTSVPTILEYSCLLYTSPSPRDLSTSRMPSSA